MGLDRASFDLWRKIKILKFFYHWDRRPFPQGKRSEFQNTPFLLHRVFPPLFSNFSSSSCTVHHLPPPSSFTYRNIIIFCYWSPSALELPPTTQNLLFYFLLHLSSFFSVLGFGGLQHLVLHRQRHLQQLHTPVEGLSISPKKVEVGFARPHQRHLAIVRNLKLNK